MPRAYRNSDEVVLVSLCGMSPAVITETVWALAHEKPPILPTRVVVITTGQGRESLRREILASGVWRDLRKHLGAKPNQLLFGDSGDSVRLLPSQDKESELEDILSADDSAAVGNFILETLRQFTENADTRVIFSIAGGRKTMSALGALAMTLLGREQDRLCHVLVNPPFDSPALQPRFHYPMRGQVHCLDQQRHPSRSAVITLHYIPFPRARDIFLREYDRLPGSFMDTVEMANRALAVAQELPTVLLDPARCQCEVAGEAVVFSPPEFLLFWRLCLGVKLGKEPIVGEDALGKELAVFHQAAVEEELAGSRIKAWSANPLGGDDYPRKLASRLRANLRKHFGARHFWPALDPCAERGQYGLLLPASSITIANRERDGRDVRGRPQAGNGAPPGVESGKRKKVN